MVSYDFVWKEQMKPDLIKHFAREPLHRNVWGDVQQVNSGSNLGTATTTVRQLGRR